jgi:hypothetical protein
MTALQYIPDIVEPEPLLTRRLTRLSKLSNSSGSSLAILTAIRLASSRASSPPLGSMGGRNHDATRGPEGNGKDKTVYPKFIFHDHH